MTDAPPPLGQPVPGWKPRPRPARAPMTGRTCRLEPLTETHLEDLWTANTADKEGRMWAYLGVGPFTDKAVYRKWLTEAATSDDPLFFAIVEAATGRALGVASYLRIDPANGVIEVGHLTYSPALQGTVMATEAMYLMMANVFDGLGYRRYEWKCNSLNAPSRIAAQRLGFSYEGIFRQHFVVKGRNRDTAWFAITDGDWPAIKSAMVTWLKPENFDGKGRQKVRLSDLTRGLRAEDPGNG